MNKNRISVGNTVFFCGTLAAAAIATTIYIYNRGLSLFAVGLFAAMFALTLMSISGGYHRLYSHRAYAAAPWLKFFYLAFGAAAFQQSCARWSTQHRTHHRQVDTPLDPYNIKQGFYWAHFGWIIREDTSRLDMPKDLAADRLILWQDKYWIWIGIAVGFGLPTWIGVLVGDPWGGFIFGGLLRMVVVHHCTFMINSLAHTIGSQPFTDSNTARDSWLTALFTFGEGYHNFHHWTPSDYRNGVRFFHWDPLKWFIFAMERVGQAWDLKRSSEEAQARARAEMEHKHATAIPGKFTRLVDEKFASLSACVAEVSDSRRVWMAAARRSASGRVASEVEHLRARFHDSRARFRVDYKAWKSLMRRHRRGSLTAAS